MNRNVSSIAFVGCLLCSLCACHHSTSYPETLLRADSLMSTHPDSALILLAHFSDSLSGADEAVQMYYRLLVTKGSDKCYIPHRSDSIMKEVVAYYQKYGPANKRMEAYYYLGSVYRDLQDAPRALDYFQRAVDASETGREYKLLGLIHSQMGTLYMYQGLYSEGAEAYRKAYQYVLEGKDSLALPFSLKNMARAYTALHNMDSTLFYYEASNKEAMRMQQDIEGAELADIYMQLNQYDKARSVLEKDKEYYILWGDLYKGVGQIDSAIYCYYQVLLSNNIYMHREAYKGLFQIEDKRKNGKKALEYLKHYVTCQDSILKNTRTEEVKRVETLYNYHQVEEENNQLVLDNESNKRNTILLGVLSAILCVIGYFVFSHQRKKKNYQLEQERRLRYFQEQSNKDNMQQIEVNLCEIAKLKDLLGQIQPQHNLAEMELLNLKAKLLEKRNADIAAIHAGQETLLAAFHTSSIYLLIQQEMGNNTFKLTDEQWSMLQKEIDSTYNNFTGRLLAICPKLTEVELHVCYLLKLSVPPSDIAHMIVRQPNTVSSIRERLYKKIHSTPGTTRMMDQFILDF